MTTPSTHNITHDILTRLTQTIESRKLANADSSYVAKLFQQHENKLLKKIGEEATELVMAAKDQDKAEIIYETADLWFHSLILLAKHDLNFVDILTELARREGLSGITEKSQRSES